MDKKSPHTKETHSANPLKKHRFFTSSDKLIGKEGHLSSPQSTMLSLKHFSSTKANRGNEIYYKLKKTEQIHSCSQISHVKSQSAGVHAQTTSLDSINRSTRRILPHTHQASTTQVPRILSQRKTILFPSNAIWPKCSPLYLYKSSQISTGPSPSTGYSCHCVFRRLDNLGNIPRSNFQSSLKNHRYPYQTGIPHKSRKISTRPKNRRNLAGCTLDNTFRSLGHTTRKAKRNKKLHQVPEQRTNMYSQTVGKDLRNPKLCDTNSNSNTSPSTAATPTTSLKYGNLKRRESTNTPVSEKCTPTMARRKYFTPNRKISFRSSSCPPLDRCFPSWVGGSHREKQCLRNLDQRRHSISHKYSGGKSSHPLNLPPQAKKPIDSVVHRQCTSPVCNKQVVLQVTSTSTRNHPASEVNKSKSTENKSPTHLDNTERKSRCIKQIIPSFSRMGNPSGDLPETNQFTGPYGSRSDGNTTEHQTDSIRVPTSRSSSNSSQCPRSGLESVERNLYIPPKMAHPDSNRITSELQVPRLNNPPLVSSRAVVPLHYEQDTQVLGTFTTRPNEKWTARLREVDRIQFLREVFTSTLGEKTAAALTTAYRASTIRQSQSVWKIFQNWLPKSVTTITTQVLMEFLIYCENDRHLDPRTILNYRSQLRLPILQAFNINLTSENFSLLARSQFLRNPPQKQKIPQWSIDPILEMLSSPRFDTKTASSSDLFLKTLFLTALASGNRVSELAAITRSGLRLTKEEAFLPTRPDFLFKNQTSKHPLPPDITFPAIGFNNTLCPVEALKVYLAKTQSMPHKDTLFVHPKSGKPLVAGRLSYWLSKTIKEGDPKAIKPAGHDVRKVSHSIAFFRQSSPEDILRNGFWHNANVFVHKYLISCRPTLCNFIAGRIK